jgi:hypothetical protein
MGTAPINAEDWKPSSGPEKSLRGFKREEVKIGEKHFVEDARPDTESAKSLPTLPPTS